MANVAPSVYSGLFPELTEQEIDTAFNKFVGIGFSNTARPDLSGVTVFLPIEKHAVNLSGGSQVVAGGANALSGPVQFSVTNTESGRFDVWWSGVLASDVPESRRLVVSAPCVAYSPWLTREPSAFVGPDAPRLLVVEGHLAVTAVAKADVTNCARNIGVLAE